MPHQIFSGVRFIRLLGAGVALALALSNAWPVHAVLGSCGTHSVYENGWPAPFLELDWSLLTVFSFSPLGLLFDIVAAVLIMLTTWPLANRIQRWSRELHDLRPLSVLMGIGPTLFVVYFRWTEFPWNFFLLGLAIPIIAGIAHGVRESLRSH